MDEHKTNNKKPDLPLSSAIIVAAFIIGLALIIIKYPHIANNQTSNDSGSQNSNTSVLSAAAIKAMADHILATKNQDSVTPVSPSDHITGSSNPKVTIIEYSDLECPYCKVFDTTINKLMQHYAASDNVAWVYRHFPLDCDDSTDPQCVPLHPKARNEALASECAFEQGGNPTFFKYINSIFAVTPSNNRLDPQVLTQTANDLGLNMDKFNLCLDTKKYAQVITDDVKSGQKININGTPTSVLVDQNGNTYEIAGAMPYEVVAATIDTLLEQK